MFSATVFFTHLVSFTVLFKAVALVTKADLLSMWHLTVALLWLTFYLIANTLIKTDLFCFIFSLVFSAILELRKINKH